MARIPVTTARQPLERGSVVQYPSSSPVGEAVNRFGGALTQTSNRIQAAQDVKQKQENLIADATFDAQLAERSRELMRKFEQDQDYTTYETRFDQESKRLITETAALIPDPQQRQLASLGAQETMAGYKDRILRMGEQKRIGAATVALDNSANTFRNILADPAASPGERYGAQQAIEAAIQQGQEAGLYDAEGAQRRREIFIRGGNYAYGQRAVEIDPSLIPVRSDASVVDKIIGVESGGNATAKNPNSSATGLGQFTRSTWVRVVRQYEPQLGEGKSRAEVLALRNDPAISRRMTTYLAQESAEALRSAGLPVTDATIYLSHFAGSEGAKSLLTADPGASAESVLGSEVIEKNEFLRGMTASDVVAWAGRKMGGREGYPAWFGELSVEQQLSIERAADSRRREILADADRREREYLTGLDDYTAYLRSGQTPLAGGPYGAEALTANLGPERASAALGEINSAQAYGADVASVRWADPDELTAMVTRRQSALSFPEGYKAGAGDLSGLIKVITGRNEALLDDPAEYVAAAPTLEAAYKRMEASQGDDRALATTAFVRASLAEQSRLGLRPDQWRVLSKDDAQDIARKFKSQPEGGQNAATMMRSLATQYGEHWPRVFGELSADLPGAALVVGSMNRPEQARAAEALAEAASLGKAKLEDRLSNKDVGTIKESVLAEMDDFGETLKANPGGPRTFATFQEAATTLALYYAGQGDSPARAARRAYDDVLGKAYNFRGTFRVPIERDAAQVEAEAERTLRSLPGDILAPVSLSGLPEADAGAAYLSALRDQGFWVTSPDETGLTLYDGQGEVVMRKDGQPYALTWGQLSRPSEAVGSGGGW